MKKPPQFPGAILMGAQSRLLPPLLPFSFMAAGVVFHIAVWAALAWAADDVPSYAGGPGPVLAAIHVLTLGVLALTAMGAALQLLPVATGIAHQSLTSPRLAWWLMVAGSITLIAGFFHADIPVMMAGAVAVAVALLLFAVVVADILRRATTLRLAVAFIWVALLSLIALIALGLALIADFELGFFADHRSIGVLHMVWAAYGFMGMLALGISNILVPMFALSPSPPPRNGWVSFGAAAAALLLAGAGLMADSPAVLLFAVGAGLIAASFHLWTMIWSLANGMRKKLGLSFMMIKLAWAMFVLGLVLAGALILGWLGPQGAALFGFAVLYGWLLTFLTGILQRIIPFLAAMNMSKRSVKPPRLSELAAEWPLRVHAVCHVAALGLGLAGIMLDISGLIFIGAGLGVVGALCFAGFTLGVARSYLRYHKAPEPDSSSPPSL